MLKEIEDTTEKKVRKKSKDKEKDKMVVYDNSFNRLTLSVLDKIELNILSFFLHALKEQGENEVIVSIADIKKYSKIKDRSSTLTQNYLDSLKKKILDMKIPVEFKKQGIKFTGRFNLFSGYAVSDDKKNFYLKIDSDYQFLINNIREYFTQYKLEDFTNLKSGYSKLLFQILKQWNSVGKLEMSITEFKEKLGIPESYRMSAVNSRVLVPIEKELPAYFEDFKIGKLKVGKNISGFIFTWTVKDKPVKSKNDNIEDAIIIEPEVLYSEKLEKAIEKCKRNHYVSDGKVLTKSNIQKLLNEYEEVDIISALEKIYKVAKQPITELNYFKKVILGIKKERLSSTLFTNDAEVINYQKEEKTEEKVIQPKDKKIVQEKIKLTAAKYKETFEKEYEEFLKENNSKKSRYARAGFKIIFDNKYEVLEEKKEKLSKNFDEFLNENFEKLKNKTFEEQMNIYKKFTDLLE